MEAVKIIKSRAKFYRASLKTDSDRSAYNTILGDLEKRQSRITVSPKILNGCLVPIETLVSYVRMDNPGLFYVDFHRFSFSQSLLKTDVIFNFLYPVSEIDDIEVKLTNKIETIIKKRNLFALSPYEKELALHDALVSNVNYEHTDKDYHKAHSAVGALLHGRAVCEGYAAAFKLLCDAAGVQTTVVSGTATNREGTENHAWNIVKLDGKCYHIDVTWDSCTRNSEGVCHSCFNLTDTDIAQDHVWDRTLLPRCTSLDYDYFVRNGSYCKNDDELRRYFSAQLKAGKKSFAVKLASKYPDHQHISGVLQSALNMRVLPLLFGYSHQIQYDPIRGTAYIKIS